MYDMTMIRKASYITTDQNDFLKGAEGGITVSEHIRRAIDEYIGRKKNQNASSSASESLLYVCKKYNGLISQGAIICPTRETTDPAIECIGRRPHA